MLVLAQPEEVEALLHHPRLWTLFQQPRLAVHWWPQEDLANKWTCPAPLLSASLESRLVWAADIASKSVLPHVQAVLARTCAVLAECLPSSPSSLSNFWQNLTLLPQARSYASLKDAARGLSVVIAGGGPSLKPVLSWYKANRSQCLLFAGGAAISGCAREGVEPDLACLIDPTESQWERSALLRKKDIPLLTTLRCHAPSLAAVRGPLLLVPRSEEVGYSDCASHLLGVQSPPLEAEILDVGGLMMAFAIFLGAKRILFAGRELCWTQQPYADGSAVLEPPIPLKGRGVPIWSTSHWLSIAEATSLTVARHPGIEWRHCSMPSLPIPGVSYQELTEWAQGCKEEERVEAVRRRLQSLPRESVAPHSVENLRRELQQGLQKGSANSPGSRLTHQILRVMEGLFRTTTEADPKTLDQWKQWTIKTLQATWKM